MLQVFTTVITLTNTVSVVIGMLQVFTTVITLTNTAHRAHVLRRHCMGPRVRLHFKTHTMYIDTANEENKRVLFFLSVTKY
jgi:hypothetical protein